MGEWDGTEKLSVPGPHHLAISFPFSCGSRLLSVSPALLSCRIHPGFGCSTCCEAGQMCWGISISFLPQQSHSVIEGNQCLNSSAPSPLWWENPKICFTEIPRVFPAGLGSTLHGVTCVTTKLLYWLSSLPCLTSSFPYRGTQVNHLQLKSLSPGLLWGCKLSLAVAKSTKKNGRVVGTKF